MADSGRLVKMEVDFSETLEKKLPEVQEMAKVSVCAYLSPIIVYKWTLGIELPVKVKMLVCSN